METNIDLKQEYLSKFLSDDEISNPRKVIHEFFSVNTLIEHKENIRRWSNYVVAKDHFSDWEDNPGSLFKIYKLNYKLIEALYFLNNVTSLPPKFYGSNDFMKQQLIFEKQHFDYYPHMLTEEEIFHPENVIMEFALHPIEDYVATLWTWLEYGLSIESCEGVLTSDEILFFQGTLLKVYEAAWLIEERVNNQKRMQLTGLSFLSPIKETSFSLPHYQEVPSLITDLTTVFKTVVPAITLVIHLGHHKTTNTNFFLIILSDDFKGNDQNLLRSIEVKCKELGPIMVVIHKIQGLLRGLNRGNMFLTNSLLSGSIVFTSPSFYYPAYLRKRFDQSDKVAEDIWRKWSTQSKELYVGAKMYFDRDNFNLCMYHLHLSIESVLIGLIDLMTGYHCKTHSLSRLLSFTLIFTDSLSEIFSSEKDAVLLDKLWKSHSCVYKETYETNLEEVISSTSKTEQIIAISDQLFKRYLESVA
jgi:HEPN domain-containing protein